MKAPNPWAMALAFAVLFFAAQALTTGPDDIQAEADSALSVRDAIAQARDLPTTSAGVPFEPDHCGLPFLPPFSK